MQKLTFAVLIILLLLPACSTAPTATPEFVNSIETEVAKQLTSLPSPTLAPTLPPTTTALPEPTATENIPPTETIAPTITSTTSPTDPRQTLGSPTWTERFDSGRAFGLEEAYDDEQTSIRVENGALVLTSKTTLGYHGWRTGGPVSADNAYIEGTFQVSNCTGSDHYGLVFRSPDFVDGYWFTVNCDGNYQLGYWQDNDYHSLYNSTSAAPAILAGSNQTNRLGVWAEGNRFILYANGQVVSEHSDTTFDEGGHAGAVIAAFQTPGFTVRLDELSYWNLP